jgi:hypothetical protein
MIEFIELNSVNLTIIGIYTTISLFFFFYLLKRNGKYILTEIPHPDEKFYLAMESLGKREYDRAVASVDRKNNRERKIYFLLHWSPIILFLLVFSSIFSLRIGFIFLFFGVILTCVTDYIINKRYQRA